MSYTPTNWQTGDTITAEKLNNMESGIAESGVYTVNIVNSGDDTLELVDAEGLEENYDNYDLFEFVIYAGQTVDPTAYHASVPARKIKTRNAGQSFNALISEHLTADVAGAVLPRSIAFTESGYPPCPQVCVYLAFGYPVLLTSSRFVINLTPTALDYSGTMDKTPAEITEAVKRGDTIQFQIPSMGAEIFPQQLIESGDNAIVAGQIVYNANGQDVLINIVTSPSSSTYTTTIFPLTPMS